MTLAQLCAEDGLSYGRRAEYANRFYAFPYTYHAPTNHVLRQLAASARSRYNTGMKPSPRLSPIHLRRWIAFVLLLAGLAACRVPGAYNTVTPPALPPGETARVIHIVDGDTITVELDNRLETVRYIGIDTPERNTPGFRAASEANRALVEGKTVRLVRDVSDRDPFGRLLRYVYLPDGVMVNARLIAQGWAMPVEYRPDLAYAEEFRRLAVEAAAQRQGFWQGTSAYDGVMGMGLVTRAATLRAAPSSSAAAVGNLTADTPLTVFARSPNSRWVQVRPPDRRGGWVAVGSVQLNVPVNTLRVIEVETSPVPAPTPTPVLSPAQARCPTGCDLPPDPTCVVKGNVNSAGERIYHLPGGPNYDRVVIRPEEGDRWFCTIAEAEQNGFRPPRR